MSTGTVSKVQMNACMNVFMTNMNWEAPRKLIVLVRKN